MSDNVQHGILCLHNPKGFSHPTKQVSTVEMCLICVHKVHGLIPGRVLAGYLDCGTPPPPPQLLQKKKVTTAFWLIT
jgi:hypothetical protein